ncbi:Hypothetical protein PBC10988_21060 [Planctomycetales bacterium 10988]|nr:Hypothetical protein PBC10988_21060 [Planctomycetales bacterium 10988]
MGLKLEENVSIDDLLYSFDREAYEEEPFDLLLFMLCSEVEREPWGRDFCRNVWNFDTECIAKDGDYVAIVKKLADLSGRSEELSDLEDHLDFEENTGWLKYKLAGKEQTWDLEIMDDWADTLTLCYVMEHLEQKNCYFYSKDNGQAMILFYLPQEVAEQLNILTNGALERRTAG